MKIKYGGHKAVYLYIKIRMLQILKYREGGGVRHV